MKSTILLAALFATTATASQAAGVVFQTPVTYTEAVTYAAGVTYLAPVTYAPGVQQAMTTPVVLERVFVTPKRRYTEHEWHTHLARKELRSARSAARSERRLDWQLPSLLRVLAIR